jgi:hypothetical protein
MLIQISVDTKDAHSIFDCQQTYPTNFLPSAKMPIQLIIDSHNRTIDFC